MIQTHTGGGILGHKVGKREPSIAEVAELQLPAVSSPGSKRNLVTLTPAPGFSRLSAVVG